LWESVQAKRSANAGEQRKGRAESGALLMGLLFDDRGNRMSPSHTTRKGDRYRYYVSQALLQGRKKEAGSIARIGADELERVVVEAIRPDGNADRIAIQNGTSKEQTPSHSPGDVDDHGLRDIISRQVERVVVHATEVEIVLHVGDTDSRSLGADGEASPSLRVSMPGPRLRDRKDIIIPGDAGTPPRRLDRSLVLAVARGRTWASALRRGEYADTAEIASKCGLGESYVRRILRLAFLAPDIVESIAEGRQPRGLTLERLLGPVPFAWAEQRQWFGFATYL
jgi:hypothetical protein